MAASMASMQQQLNNAATQQQNAASAGMNQLQAQLQAMNMANAAAQTNARPTGNWQQQWPPAQQQIMPACPPAYPNNQMQRGNTKQKTPYRCYENHNYCWTHGHHIEDDHTSATCTMPYPGHQPAATKNNTMGGSNAGAHKSIMPSQSGRTRRTEKQRQPSRAYTQWKAAGFPAGGPKQFRDMARAQRNTQQYPNQAYGTMIAPAQQYQAMQFPQMQGPPQMGTQMGMPMGMWQQPGMQNNRGY